MRSLFIIFSLLLGTTMSHSSTLDENRTWELVIPVDSLSAFPEGQRSAEHGFVNDQKAWTQVWSAVKPREEVPEIDFGTEVVLWAKNTRYLNSIRVLRVEVEDETATLTTRQSRSARPIKNVLNCVFFVVQRDGINNLKTPTEIVPIPQPRERR